MTDTANRTVSDILNSEYGVVAFTALASLIGGRPTIYQGVCPWCSQDLGTPIQATIYGELYAKLKSLQHLHMQDCPRHDMSSFSVRLPDGTTGFLNEREVLRRCAASQAER